MARRKALIHYAMPRRKGNYTACGRRAWYTRTRYTHDVYTVTCPKCKAALRASRFDQPCGHPRSAIVQAAEGTAYCGECEKEARSGTPTNV